MTPLQSYKAGLSLAAEIADAQETSSPAAFNMAVKIRDEIREMNEGGRSEYLLTQDGDCHWFVIPADRQVEWDQLTTNEEFEIPEWAEEVCGGPGRVTFPFYHIRGHTPTL